MQPPQNSQFVQQPQPQFMNTQPMSVTTAMAPDGDFFRPSALTQMRVLSIIQIVLGGLSAVFGIALACLSSDSTQFYLSFGNIGYGIWIGVYFIIVGGVGLGAVRSNTKCWIISTMVLNIICSSLWCYLLVGMSSVGVSASRSRNYYYYGYMDRSDERTSVLALNSLLLVMAIAELIITIWSAALCCGAVCRCCKSPQGGRVFQYYPNQQPVAMYNVPPMTAAYSGSQPAVVQGQHMHLVMAQQSSGIVPPVSNQVAQSEVKQQPQQQQSTNQQSVSGDTPPGYTQLN